MKGAFMQGMFNYWERMKMGDFSKDNLYEIYGNYLAQFTELAQLANKYGVYFELNISPEGDIEFRSRKYFEKNSKQCVNTMEIKQGKDYVNENCRTTVLKDLKGENSGKE